MNNDGEENELDVMLQSKLRRSKAQRQMAWTAMVSMLVATAVLFSPFVPESRVNALATMMELFYLAQAGVVAAFMGFEAMTDKTKWK